MMQLGFVSVLPEQNLEEVFHTAAAIGYDCVEVMCWPPGKSTRRYAGSPHRCHQSELRFDLETC